VEESIAVELRSCGRAAVGETTAKDRSIDPEEP